MNDYGRIAKIVQSLDENYQEQPDLNALARRAGLSPYHFHRLFSAWVGLTPKDFLQCLTAAHAKKMLQAGRDVMSTALEAGLSGPGRLHDLCVNLEAASPGEIKSGGEGLRIKAGFVESPFGKCLMAESSRGLCHISFVDQADEKAMQEIRTDWPCAKITHDDRFAERLGRTIFHQKPAKNSPQNFRALVKGTEFQVKVWRALLRIPKGALVTYGDLASQIKSPKAFRAVGTAVGRNPLAFLIPCHRVIRETGVIGDYHWGRTRKRVMIAWENLSSKKG